MKQIFKKTTGSPAANDKVGDYNFKEFCPEVNMNMSWASLATYIRQAALEQVIPFTGQAIYDDIATKVQDGTALAAEVAVFLEHLRDAVACHAFARALPLKKVTVASMGSLENVAKEGTTTTTQWGFRAALWAAVKNADLATDRLLAYLEKMVVEEVAYFDLWKTDPAFTAGSSDFFRATADFQVYFNINSSRRTFLQIVPILKQAAKVHILPALGQAQYDALVTAVKTNTLTEAQEALLLQVRSALAPWAIYHACSKLPALPEHDGFRVVSNAEAVDNRTLPQEALLRAIDGIKYAAEEDAKTNTADLAAFLVDNADDYPLWEASNANPENNTSIYNPPICDQYGAVMF